MKNFPPLACGNAEPNRMRHPLESRPRTSDLPPINWTIAGILSVRRGRVLEKLEDPKTERAIRDVEITAGMARALKRQRPQSYLAGKSVFVTEKGKPIDLNNFRLRVWEPALKKAKLSYRYPYQLRHTFATRQIAQGKNPVWIAHQMGTSLEILFKNYAVYFQNRGWSQCDQTGRVGASSGAKRRP